MEQRIKDLQSVLDGGEAALITNGTDRIYLTGFRSSAGVVFVTSDSCRLLVDFRYYEKAKKTVKCADVMLADRLFDKLNMLISEQNITRVYVQPSVMTLGSFETYNNKLGGILSSDSRVDDKISAMRMIKDAGELANIKKAQQYTDKAFDYILGRISAGRAEREIMLDMEFYTRKLGSEGVAFDFIVVSGKNSSMPHGVPTDKKVENGDFITMDFGAVANGYRSDMTRTVAVGYVSERQESVYNTVLKAQEIAFDSIAEGAVCKDVDRAARDYIYARGYEGCFGHGLGHSVGLDIHESPAFNTRCETILKSGMVMTVEPGIYLEDKFGVRIEDMVAVTPTGFENLTHSKKELIIL